MKDKKITIKEKKAMARDLLMEQVACACYGNRYEQYLEEVGDDAQEILYKEANRIAKLFGEKQAWFY